MSDQNLLTAEVRERAGKGAARAVRRAGRVPAVLYGDKKESLMLSLEPKELHKLMIRPGFYSTVFDVKVGKDSHKALARDVQFHPLTDAPLHVDFMRITKGATVTVEVACSFENEEESPGLKRGGVLNVVRHVIELSCPTENIPQVLIVDLTGSDIGDSIHISQIELPDGVAPTITDRDFTIATIAAPSAMAAADDEDEEEEGEEGEEEEGEIEEEE